MLLTFVFCVCMTTKKPDEATYFMAGNSFRIREKIQIHFEINFVSLNDIAFSTLSLSFFLSCFLGQKITYS